jgi:hypothetical protein
VPGFELNPIEFCKKYDVTVMNYFESGYAQEVKRLHTPGNLAAHARKERVRQVLFLEAGRFSKKNMKYLQ